MADTKIEWAEKVWNPVTGCTPVSAGCQNCYAERMANRFGHGEVKAGVRRCYDGDFQDYRPAKFSEVVFHPDRLDQPLRWRKPRRVFVCSMGDLFHEYVPFEWIAKVWNTFFDCGAVPPHGGAAHTFMILTKRPIRMLHFSQIMNDHWGRRIDYPNVWLGVSIEDQKTADERIPILLQTPAALRFVSVEPMLGRIDMVKTVGIAHLDMDRLDGNLGPDWVICGEESGPKRRLAPINAIEELRDQCVSAGVPFFLKQMDVNGKLVKMPELDGKVWAEFPEGKD